MYTELGCFAMSSFKRKNPHKYIITVGLLVSASTEIMQYIFSKGLFEIDDLFNNTIGTVVGVLLFKLCKRIEVFTGFRKK